MPVPAASAPTNSYQCPCYSLLDLYLLGGGPEDKLDLLNKYRTLTTELLYMCVLIATMRRRVSPTLRNGSD